MNVLQASRSYLSRSNDQENYLQFLPSLNAWVADLLPSGVQFSPLYRDRPLRTDPEKLRICLENLIRNALTHGQAPVLVRIRHDSRHLCFEVEDAGSGRSARAGLGLGLKISRWLAKGLGGKITRNAKPTIYALTLPMGDAT